MFLLVCLVPNCGGINEIALKWSKNAFVTAQLNSRHPVPHSPDTWQVFVVREPLWRKEFSAEEIRKSNEKKVLDHRHVFYPAPRSPDGAPNWETHF